MYLHLVLAGAIETACAVLGVVNRHGQSYSMVSSIHHWRKKGGGTVALPPSLERCHIPNMLTMFIQLLHTLLLLLAIFEYKVLLLKVIYLSSECTRIDLRFQNNSLRGMPLGPLDWCGFIVSC